MEKDNAIAQDCAIQKVYDFTRMPKLLQLIQVLVAVLFISWCFPTVYRFISEYVLDFSCYLMNQHVVFLVGNVIVGVCYVLTRYSDSGMDSGNEPGYDGRYDCVTLTHRRTTSDGSDSKPMHSVVTESSLESSMESSVESENTMIVNVKSMVKTESEKTVETAIKQATKQTERIQRTKSDESESMKPCRELRRSVTEMRRRRKVASGEEKWSVKSLKAVDELSNEEFRIAVETFILKQQRLIKQQSMVEDEG